MGANHLVVSQSLPRSQVKNNEQLKPEQYGSDSHFQTDVLARAARSKSTLLFLFLHLQVEAEPPICRNGAKCTRP